MSVNWKQNYEELLEWHLDLRDQIVTHLDSILTELEFAKKNPMHRIVFLSETEKKIGWLRDFATACDSTKIASPKSNIYVIQ